MAGHRSAGVGSKVQTIELDDLAVTTAKLAALAVTTAKLADDSINAAKLKTDSVTTPKLVIGSVTGIKIAANSIDSSKIQTNAVQELEINALAVTNAKINDVDASKITAGLIAAARLGSGATSSKFLRGDQTYQTVGGLTLSDQNDELVGSDSTTSTTFVSSNLSITIANRSGGRAVIQCVISAQNNTLANDSNLQIFNDGVAVGSEVRVKAARATTDFYVGQHVIQSLDGSVINLRFRTGAGSTTTLNGTFSSMHILELS